MEVDRKEEEDEEEKIAFFSEWKAPTEDIEHSSILPSPTHKHTSSAGSTSSHLSASSTGSTPLPETPTGSLRARFSYFLPSSFTSKLTTTSS
jgi:hypothetical protein